jgi:maleylacetoacetate isomerase
MSSDLVLYSYWRSSAAYRVRIALNLKQLAYEIRPIHLVRDGGEHHSAAYAAINPQEQLPTLIDGALVVRQSLAIMEYLEETRPATHLLPQGAAARARVRALAQAVACDIHPLGNLRALQQLEKDFAASSEQRVGWTRHWIALGFTGLERLLAESPDTGVFCHGDTPTLADACLVPQYYNAVRWNLPLEAYPTIRRIHAACADIEAFRLAAPEAQPDAA